MTVVGIVGLYNNLKSTFFIKKNFIKDIFLIQEVQNLF